MKYYPQPCVCSNGYWIQDHLLMQAMILRHRELWLQTTVGWDARAEQLLHTNAQRYADLRRVLRMSQTYAEMIWGRWNKEYLPQRSESPEWNEEESRQLKVKVLVNMVVGNVERAHYSVDRVLEF